MDKFKEYLLRHKADLDADSPASDSWESIESKMAEESDRAQVTTRSIFQVKPGFSSKVLRYAVAACMIALAGTGVWLLIRNKRQASDMAKQVDRPGKSEPSRGTDTIQNAIRKEEKAPIKEVARHTIRPTQMRQKTGASKPAASGSGEISGEVDNIDRSYSKLIDYQLKKLRATPLYAENGGYFSFYVEQFKQMDQDEQSVRDAIKTYGLTSGILEQLINVYQQKLNLLKNLETEINKMNNKVREKQTPSEKPDVHYLNI